MMDHSVEEDAIINNVAEDLALPDQFLQRVRTLMPPSCTWYAVFNATSGPTARNVRKPSYA